MPRQLSIKESLRLNGINVFNGKKNYAIFHPAIENSGITFKVYGESIPVKIEKAHNYRDWRTLRLASCIAIDGEKERAVKVEHTLSSIYALGIDNLIIELSDGVCPRQDNSVSELISALAPLRKEGCSDKSYLTLKGGLSLEERTVKKPGQTDRLTVKKAKGCIIDYTAHYPHRIIGRQHHRLELSEANYKNEIMGSRGIFFLPFGSRFLIDSFLKKFHGVTDSNALFIGAKDDPYFANNISPRGIYGGEEFVRHKILDVIGALALTGKWFQDVEFRFAKTGHKFDVDSIKTLFERNCFMPKYLKQ